MNNMKREPRTPGQIYYHNSSNYHHHHARSQIPPQSPNPNLAQFHPSSNHHLNTRLHPHHPFLPSTHPLSSNHLEHPHPQSLHSPHLHCPRSHFFGEEWRCCSRRLHIVPAARVALATDLAILLLEFAFFVPQIGRLDAVCWVQLSCALFGLGMALTALLPGGGHRRHNYLWPLISFKLIECVICALLLLLIFALSVSGPWGVSALRWLIRWKYPRVEDDDSVAFSLLTFLLLSFLAFFNCYILHTLNRARKYLRLNALHLYSQHRNQIIRNLVIQ